MSTIELVREARKSGFTVSRTRNGHLAFKAPDGSTVYGPSTPGSSRNTQNMRAELRRHGLGTHSDNRREARLARAKDSGKSLTLRVLEVLQAHPGEQLSSAKIRDLLGGDEKPNNIGASLFGLNEKHPELSKLGRGLWVYVPRNARSKTASAITAARVVADALLSGDTLSNGSNGNGHSPAVEVAEAPEPRRPITVVPSALPDDVPALFEAVTVHRSGAVVLRDQNGEIWLAHPVKIELPSIGLATS